MLGRRRGTIDLSYIGEAGGQWDGMGCRHRRRPDRASRRSRSSHCSAATCSTTGVRCRIFATANPPGEGKEHWFTKMLTAGGWIGEDGFPVQEMAGHVRYYTRDGDTTDEFIFADTVEELIATGHVPRDVDGTPIRPQSVSFFPALIDDHRMRTSAASTRASSPALTLFERRRRLEGNWYATESAASTFIKGALPARRELQKAEFWRAPGQKLGQRMEHVGQSRLDAGRPPEHRAGWRHLCPRPVAVPGHHGSRRARDHALRGAGRAQGQIRLPKDAGAGGIQSAIAQRLGPRASRWR